ncbi:MAG: CpaD family pilus assembly lipoprotein [Alphaproteobacteria bacterium]
MARHRMITRCFAPVAVLGLLSLGACSASMEGYTPTATTSKRPVAEWTVSKLDLRFEPGSARLSAGEEKRFVNTLAMEDATRPIRLVARTNASGIAPELAVERAAVLREMASARGFSVQYQADGVALDDPAASDTAYVYIGRYEVTVPGCPDWRKPVVADFSNKESTNLGCANAMNLALMLADPGDLAWGDALSSADGQREALAVERYRAGTQPRIANPDLPNARSTQSLTGN